ncbi:hypothetical protein AWENTII_010230 [Aspergillus wentii]
MVYTFDAKSFYISTGEIGLSLVRIQVGVQGDMGPYFDIDDTLNSRMSIFDFDVLKNVRPEERYLLKSKPEPEPEVNWKIVSSWLHECRSNHEHLVYANQVTNFRIIDTVRGCVVMAPASCEYAALSYVWGKATENDMAATTATINKLEADGFLFQHPQPMTIQDAITACGKLGIRYLWIDRLCIIQDSEEKLAQINAMDAIYSRSTVTLVTLAGTDANHGLPGVSKKRYKWPVLQTHRLGIAKSRVTYNDALAYSKWNTRGWTFQEAILSPRLLCFSDYGVFFECCHDSDTENEIESLHPDATDTYSTFSDEAAHSVHSDVTDLVADYTGRYLTYGTDILHAISGVLNAKCGPYHHFGLSLHGIDFNKMICWGKPHGWTPRVQPRDGIFPSWSWCSEEGDVVYWLTSEQIAAPFALWALVATESEGHPLRIFQYENRDGWRSWDDYCAQGGALAMLYAWREGCYPGKLPPALNLHGTWTQIRDHLVSAMSFYDLCKAAHGLGDDRTNRYFPSSAISLASQSGRLLLYTQFIRLPLSILDEDREFEFWLFNAEGHRIVFVEASYANVARLEEISLLEPSPDIHVIAMSLGFVEHYPRYRFVKHSIYSHDSNGRRLTWDTDQRKFRGYVTGNQYVYAFVVNVMLVEIKDGICKRVGIGEVYLSRWIKEKPEFGTFVLE